MEDFNLIEYLAAGVVLLAASALQGAVGFAAGLFGIPLLMLLAGMDLPSAVMVMLLASFVQNFGGLYHLRKRFDVRDARLPMLIRLAAIPLGLLALHFATALPEAQVKAMIGAVILLLLFLRWALAPGEPKKLHPAWMPAAFGSSGFLVGFCGMGGPPMVLWVMAQPWSSEKSRAFLFFMFTTSLIPHCLLMWWMYGEQIHAAALLALLGTPWVIAGTGLGLWIGSYLPKDRLRIAAYVILIITAIAAICAPLV